MCVFTFTLGQGFSVFFLISVLLVATCGGRGVARSWMRSGSSVGCWMVVAAAAACRFPPLPSPRSERLGGAVRLAEGCHCPHPTPAPGGGSAGWWFSTPACLPARTP